MRPRRSRGRIGRISGRSAVFLCASPSAHLVGTGESQRNAPTPHRHAAGRLRARRAGRRARRRPDPDTGGTAAPADRPRADRHRARAGRPGRDVPRLAARRRRPDRDDRAPRRRRPTRGSPSPPRSSRADGSYEARWQTDVTGRLRTRAQRRAHGAAGAALALAAPHEASLTVYRPRRRELVRPRLLRPHDRVRQRMSRTLLGVAHRSCRAAPTSPSPTAAGRSPCPSSTAARSSAAAAGTSPSPRRRRSASRSRTASARSASAEPLSPPGSRPSGWSAPSAPARATRPRAAGPPACARSARPARGTRARERAADERGAPHDRRVHRPQRLEAPLAVGQPRSSGERGRSHASRHAA